MKDKNPTKGDQDMTKKIQERNLKELSITGGISMTSGTHLIDNVGDISITGGISKTGGTCIINGVGNIVITGGTKPHGISMTSGTCIIGGVDISITGGISMTGGTCIIGGVGVGTEDMNLIVERLERLERSLKRLRLEQDAWYNKGSQQPQKDKRTAINNSDKNYDDDNDEQREPRTAINNSDKNYDNDNDEQREPRYDPTDLD